MLERTVAERISIAMQSRERCLQSTSTQREDCGATEDEIELARRGTSSDPRYAAMIAYGLQVYRDPTTTVDEQIEALRSHGFQ